MLAVHPAQLLDASLRLLPELFLKATLVLVAAGALAFALRRSSAAARHQVWAVAIAGVLALPFSQMLPWQAAVLPAFLRPSASASAWTPHPATPSPRAAVTSSAAG